MTVSIEWHEDAVKKEVYGAIGKIVSGSAYAGERAAKQNARVDTGRMRSNIEVVKLGAFLYGLQCLVEYAIFNELGTVNDPGKPFMRPGRDAGAEYYRKAVQKAFR